MHCEHKVKRNQKLPQLCKSHITTKSKIKNGLGQWETKRKCEGYVACKTIHAKNQN